MSPQSRRASRDVAVRILESWLANRRFEEVREGRGPPDLTPKEAEEWRKLWKEIRAKVAELRGKGGR